VNRTVTLLCALVLLGVAPAVAQRRMQPRAGGYGFVGRPYAHRYAPYYGYRFAPPRYMMGRAFQRGFARPGFRQWRRAYGRPYGRRMYGWRGNRRGRRNAI